VNGDVSNQHYTLHPKNQLKSVTHMNKIRSCREHGITTSSFYSLKNFLQNFAKIIKWVEGLNMLLLKR